MAEFNAFTGGIEPGGLRNQNDIRILICYVLSGVGAPLSAQDIAKIMQENAIANYFEIMDAISFLEEKENILRLENDNLTVTSTGEMIAKQLDTILPSSVRDKALESAIKLMARAKTELENKAEIIKTELGCDVVMSISGGPFNLLELRLHVADTKQAKLVKERFYSDPLRIYSLTLAALTGDKAMQKSILEND